MKAFHNQAELKSSVLAHLSHHITNNTLVTSQQQFDETMLKSAQSTALATLPKTLIQTVLRIESPKTELTPPTASFFPNQVGLPAWYAETIQTIHDGLPTEEKREFAYACIENIPVGADLNQIYWQFAAQHFDIMHHFIFDDSVDAEDSLKLLADGAQEFFTSMCKNSYILVGHRYAVKQGLLTTLDSMIPDFENPVDAWDTELLAFLTATRWLLAADYPNHKAAIDAFTRAVYDPIDYAEYMHTLSTILLHLIKM